MVEDRYDGEQGSRATSGLCSTSSILRPTRAEFQVDLPQR